MKTPDSGTSLDHDPGVEATDVLPLLLECVSIYSVLLRRGNRAAEVLRLSPERADDYLPELRRFKHAHEAMRVHGRDLPVFLRVLRRLREEAGVAAEARETRAVLCVRSEAIRRHAARAACRTRPVVRLAFGARGVSAPRHCGLRSRRPTHRSTASSSSSPDEPEPALAGGVQHIADVLGAAHTADARGIAVVA